MTLKNKILLIGGLILITQIIIFSDYISPIHWGQIKVSGLACTCPDESVDNGRLYIRSITPDSLKKYDLDYSEIYVSNRPYTDLDPMGVDQYMIKGRVIGKDRVWEGDPWNPKIEIESWRPLNWFKNILIKGLFFIQIIIFIILIIKAKK